ncbi:MAG: PIN domain-containing protein [Chloroflexota bacterium]
MADNAGGWHAQRLLWALLDEGALEVAELSANDTLLVSRLMERYRDLPMDLADASLVALAERTGVTQVPTLDRDFHVYRLSRGRAFSILP